jgi:hypothetical protein
MTDRSTPERLEASLRLAREIFSPSDAARERVWSGVAARTAASAASSQPGAAGPKGTAPRAAARSGTRVLALGKASLLVGLGFLLGYWSAERRIEWSAPVAVPLEVAAGSQRAPGQSPSPPLDAPPSPPRDLPAPARPEARALASGEQRPDGDGASKTRPVPAPRAPRASLARSSSTSAEELTLLSRAERAIRAGDGALARSFITELEARHPNSAWREEREAILVLAACSLSEPGADRDALAFLERHASSVYFDRIGKLCRLDADGTPRLGH